VPDAEHLLEIGSVGVAVEIDLSHAQLGEDCGQIVSGRCGAEEGGSIAQRIAAGADHLGRPPLRRLQAGTIERARLAGAAVVHDQHVPSAPQRIEQRQIFVARLGGGISGAALGRYEHADSLAATGMRVELEIDRETAGNRSRGIERPFETAAVNDRAGRCVGTAGQRHVTHPKREWSGRRVGCRRGHGRERR